MHVMNVDRILYLIRTYSWLCKAWALPFTPEYKIQAPIFLLGTQGGGLTLLSRILRRHPSAISVAGNNDYWTSADELANAFGLFLPFEFAGLRYKAPSHPVLTAPRSWTYASKELLPQYRKTASDANNELKRKLIRAIRFAIMLHGNDKENCRFVDKSQSTTLRVGFFYELLKEYDPRFVLVTRNPYAAIYRAANGKAGDIRRLSNKLCYEERVRICTEHYMNSVRAVFEDAKLQGIPIHIVQFEQILEKPERTVRRVCEFVDLDFSRDMLPNPDHCFPLGSRFKGRWWPLRVDVNSAYIEAIEDWVIEKVNSIGEDLIYKLGYEVLGRR